MDNGTIADMRERGIVESYKLKRQVVSSATEAAEMILRVDDIIRAAPRYARAPLVVCPCYVCPNVPHDALHSARRWTRVPQEARR